MAADYPPPLTKNEIKELFIQVSPPEPNTFEIALVLVALGRFSKMR
jgi:hypothetical protein